MDEFLRMAKNTIIKDIHTKQNVGAFLRVVFFSIFCAVKEDFDIM